MQPTSNTAGVPIGAQTGVRTTANMPTTGATTGGMMATNIVPAGAPSKQDATLTKRGSSSSSSSSSDEENVTRKEHFTTETLEARGIPRALPAEHVREAPTQLPTQHVRAVVDPNPRPNFPTRLPSEHVYDDKPGMYHGQSETVTNAGIVRTEHVTAPMVAATTTTTAVPAVTHGMRDMRVAAPAEKVVTVAGAEADRLEARDRAMGRKIDHTDPHHTVANPPGAAALTGRTAGTGLTGTGVTGTGTGVTGTGTGVTGTGTGMTGATTAGRTTGTTTTGTTATDTAAHGAHHKEGGGLMGKVKAMLPGHHAK